MSDVRERFGRREWIFASDWFLLYEEDRRGSNTRRDSKYEDEGGSAALGFKRGRI